MSPKTLLIAALLPLTACSHLTTFSPLQVEPPPSAMIKSGPVAPLPASADLGTIMNGYGDLALQYGVCAARHNTLVDFLTPSAPASIPR